jgi:extracellular factor (EF) 3-hydroxypalmitic acid methyl ester biosynthesis protein
MSAEAMMLSEDHGPSADPTYAASSADAGPTPIVVLDRLKHACDRFLALQEERTSPLELLHATAAGLHGFAASVLACEQAGLDRSTLLPHLTPVRALHARSPFVERLQTWPRGYPGDFETVEWLCEAKNHAPVGTVGWAIEQYALQSPVAQQHRNKVGLQARAILSTLVEKPDARVASIGCGGCRDLSLIQNYIPPTDGTFVLVDADADALAFARARLDRLADRSEFVHGRVPRVLASVAPKGPFELVVAGGLFDYLPDRWAIATLGGVRRMLAPGGVFLFSNIAAGNPFRAWLEYLAEWRLIERQESDIRRLLAAADFEGTAVHIFRDSTELALMAEVRT